MEGCRLTAGMLDARETREIEKVVGVLMKKEVDLIITPLMKVGKDMALKFWVNMMEEMMIG